ncbi:response regulator [Ignavibacteria bacterium]|nr:chemotaxis protein CheA [Bacteroidota bacterium]
MGADFIDPDMQEIFESFCIETQELLDNLMPDLMLLEQQSDSELLNRIFRGFHTIKGTSSFMGFDTISTITHEAENILNKLRRNEMETSQPLIDVLLEVHDWIQLLLKRIMGGDLAPVDYSATIARLKALNNAQSDNPKANVLREESALSAVLSNKEIVQGSDDFSDEELAAIQAAFAEINADFAKSAAPQDSGDFTPEEELAIQAAFAEVNAGMAVNSAEKEGSQGDFTPEEEVQVQAAFAEVNRTFREAAAAQVSAAAAKPPSKQAADVAQQPDTTKKSGTVQAESTIRVDVARVETLMDLSGELVLGRNRLTQIANRFHNQSESGDLLQELFDTVAQVDFITSEIQTAVMKMRMIPIGKLYQKAPRIVRDLSKEFHKEIDLSLKGEETEIDRGIIEELNDPLVHMIRNSCDHGIETPAERIEKGKPARGHIVLDAEQEGNNIVIRISDDGRGMDHEKLKAKAIEKGLITPEQAAAMSMREAFQLIFQPGFSTAAVVSSVSGRGVGMDVVRTNILKLKGIIEIESEIGVGSTFVIKLPLTLAIIQGLLVGVGNEVYAIPLGSVVEVVDAERSAISTVNLREVIRIREQVLPLLRLRETLQTPYENEATAKEYVVVVGLAHQRIGIVVDKLFGQQEIVIKPLSSLLGSIQGIAGSTILGDGRVIMIVDIAELLAAG